MTGKVVGLGPIEAVSLDFTGTLAHVPRLGALYAETLARHEIPVEAEVIARLFRESWAELACRARLGEDRFRSHPGGAEGFWGALLKRILERLDRPAPSPFLVTELFDRFRRADAWEVFPDVRPTLRALADRGLRLAVVSDFDHRLPGILHALDLADRFEAVVTSWDVGAEKPHARPFETAVRRLGVHPRRLVHVGDDRRRDVEGAVAAGLRGLWLDRGGDPEADLHALTELPDRLHRLDSSFW